MKKLLRKWLGIESDYIHMHEHYKHYARETQERMEKNNNVILANLNQILSQQTREQMEYDRGNRRNAELLDIVCALIISGHEGSAIWDAANSVLARRDT